MTIGIYTIAPAMAKSRVIRQAVAAIERRGGHVLLLPMIAQAVSRADLICPQDELMDKSDILMVFGGDGTMLSAARNAVITDTPVFGVNLGKIGFLPETEVPDIDEAVDCILSGRYRIEERMMLRCRLDDEDMGIALNDVVIARGAVSRMVNVHIDIDGEAFTQYRADGVIVSTPTGSTAYALSTGGPIISPELECLLISPICPHSLYNRSVVVGDKTRIAISVTGANDDAMVTLDGQIAKAVKPGNIVTISRAEQTAKFVRLRQESFYRTLHRKLSSDHL
ncbi:MAG: NAD(+)/NADH kinase [Christensenellales bacterium]